MSDFAIMPDDPDRLTCVTWNYPEVRIQNGNEVITMYRHAVSDGADEWGVYTDSCTFDPSICIRLARHLIAKQ